MVLFLQIGAPNMSKGLGVAEQQRVQNWHSSLLASVPVTSSFLLLPREAVTSSQVPSA